VPGAPTEHSPRVRLTETRDGPVGRRVRGGGPGEGAAPVPEAGGGEWGRATRWGGGWAVGWPGWAAMGRDTSVAV
ncbi:hypothetical protein QM716_29195, partial [Rhodococcus sp. IEGM 1409]|uniref:hypothetical protein n=1 Tax=Rhodococcus sp. IEGM 1409 TaxID=3047082 RepID=UPI0024B65E03